MTQKITKINTEDVLKKALALIDEDRELIKNKINDLPKESWSVDKIQAKAMTDLLEGLQRGNEQLIKIAAVVFKAEPEVEERTTSPLDLINEAIQRKENTSELN
jgi:hypothetical protein